MPRRGFPHSDIVGSHGCTPLTDAFRSVPRPSSADVAKASPIGPYSLPPNPSPRPSCLDRVIRRNRASCWMFFPELTIVAFHHTCVYTHMPVLPQQPPLLTLFSICCLLCRICQLTIHLLMCANSKVSSTRWLSKWGRFTLQLTNFIYDLSCLWHDPASLPRHTHGDKGARTPDLRLAKASLSQLSYVPVWE
jgi:hypothetical protein